MRKLFYGETVKLSFSILFVINVLMISEKRLITRFHKSSYSGTVK